MKKEVKGYRILFYVLVALSSILISSSIVDSGCCLNDPYFCQDVDPGDGSGECCENVGLDAADCEAADYWWNYACDTFCEDDGCCIDTCEDTDFADCGSAANFRPLLTCSAFNDCQEGCCFYFRDCTPGDPGCIPEDFDWINRNVCPVYPDGVFRDDTQIAEENCNLDGYGIEGRWGTLSISIYTDAGPPNHVSSAQIEVGFPGYIFTPGCSGQKGFKISPLFDNPRSSFDQLFFNTIQRCIIRCNNLNP